MTNTPAQIMIALTTLAAMGAFLWPLPRHIEPLIQQRSAVAETISE